MGVVEGKWGRGRGVVMVESGSGRSWEVRGCMGSRWWSVLTR